MFGPGEETRPHSSIEWVQANDIHLKSSSRLLQNLMCLVSSCSLPECWFTGTIYSPQYGAVALLCQCMQSPPEGWAVTLSSTKSHRGPCYRVSHISGRCTSLATEPLAHTPMRSQEGDTYLVWCHKEVHDVVVELLECFLDVLLEEILHLSSDDGVLVVHHVREVGGVVVL